MVSLWPKSIYSPNFVLQITFNIAIPQTFPVYGILIASLLWLMVSDLVLQFKNKHSDKIKINDSNYEWENYSYVEIVIMCLDGH